MSRNFKRAIFKKRGFAPVLFVEGKEKKYSYDIDKDFPGENYAIVSEDFLEDVCRYGCEKWECVSKIMEDGDKMIVVSPSCPFYLEALCCFPKEKEALRDKRAASCSSEEIELTGTN